MFTVKRLAVLMIITTLLAPSYFGTQSVDAAIGDTWTAQTSGVTHELEDVHFVDANTGFAVGHSGTILKTTNGGTMWHAQTSGVTHILNDVYFIDANTGFAVGGHGTILKTTDGGSNWHAQTIHGTFAGPVITSVDFIDANNGLATLFHAGINNHVILKSTDGGATWHAQTIHGTTGIFRSIDFVDSTTAFAVGDGGVIFKSTDAGVNWHAQTSGVTHDLWGVSFVDANTGFAVGHSGTILKTTNGGTMWHAQTSGVTHNLESVSFVDANTGFAVGHSGTILKTTNGGTMWHAQTSGVTHTLNGVSFVNAHNVFAVGGHGTILKSADSESGTTCEQTIAHLITEMTHNRAYLQFHTRDTSNSAENTGPGNLPTPGEIRGDIAPNTTPNPTMFTATANKAQNVHSGGSEPAAWANALATATVTLMEHAASGSTPHHIMVTIVMGADHNLANISGIHIHNGAPGHSNSVHLADILTATASLLKHGTHTVNAGATLTAGQTYTAMITASDVCPTSHGGHNHGGDSGGDSGSGSTCEQTIAHLINEMTHNRAYVQFHTRDTSNSAENTGPGNLPTPGEIRADIAPNTTPNPTSFGGTANKAQNVHSGGSEPAAWANALATATVTLVEHAASGSTPHHIMVTIVMGSTYNLDNISGIHIHNGAPGHSNSVHLADILTATASLLKHGTHTVNAGATLTAGQTYTAMITASDVCPTSHGGHNHGGDSGGDSGSGDSGSGSGDSTGKVFDIVTLILAGQVLQPGDYLSVANYGNTAVGGEFQARLPCDANGVPLVLVVSGHIDADPTKSYMADANLVIVEHLSTKGKSCLYQASWPAASTMNNAGAQQISSIGLYNVCEKNNVFRTANVAVFHANDDRGAVNTSTLPSSSSTGVFPSNGDVVIDKYDGTSISGNVCGLTTGDSGGDGGHDHNSHDHGS